MNELEIMQLMDSIEYGWVDKNSNKHYDIDDDFSNNYNLQSISEILINKIGVCWDQVELERYYFESNNFNIKSFFIVYYDENICPTHTFLVYEKNNKVYWFEHAWNLFRGIHEYNDLNELLLDIKNKYAKYELNNKYIDKNLVIYNYSKPESHLTVNEFYKHCESGVVYLLK